MVYGLWYRAILPSEQEIQLNEENIKISEEIEHKSFLAKKRVGA
jgi:hypothetical protein